MSERRYQLSVSVQTRYLGDQSDPSKGQFAFAYTIRITNQGFANLTNVQLIATMDQLMGYVSSSNGTVNGATITFRWTGAPTPAVETAPSAR